MDWTGETIMLSVLLCHVEGDEVTGDRRKADYVIEVGEQMFFPVEPGMKLTAEPGPEENTVLIRWKAG